VPLYKKKEENQEKIMKREWENAKHSSNFWWVENGRKMVGRKQWVGQVRNLPWNRKMAAKLTSELYYLYFFSFFLFICALRERKLQKNNTSKIY